MMTILFGRRLGGDKLQKRKSPTPKRRALPTIRCSDSLQIGGGRLAGAAIGLDVEADLLTLDQPGHSRALDGGHMNEHVRASVVLHDKAETLLGVEELDGTLSHDGLLENAQRRLLAAQTIHAGLYPDLAWSWGWPSAGRYKAGKISNAVI
jgi:hypothetical protein